MAEAATVRRTTRCRTLWSDAELRALIAGLSDRALLLDLTRAGLSPFFAAQQVCAQIGQDFDPLLADLPPLLLPANGQVAAKHIGSWIDFELYGDVARIAADRVASCAGAFGFDALVVLLPPSADALTRADGVMIDRLVHLAGMIGAEVTFTFPRAHYPLPQDWTAPQTTPGSASAVPGGLDAQQTTAKALPDSAATGTGETVLPPGPLPQGLGQKLSLLGYALPPPVTAPNGVQILAPQHRFAPPPEVPDALAAYALHWGWLGLPFVLDRMPAQRVAQLAWQALAARDGELATRLATQAMAQPGDTTFASTTLGTLHIINQAYDALLEGAAETQTDRINQAWGETLAGDATAALAVFDGAKARDPVFALYLRNIAALAHFRNGDAARAWQLQRDIAADLAGLATASPHLRFLNQLNMSRLARADRAFETAETLLEAAFAARGAGQSEHDAFYHRVLSAALAPDPATQRTRWEKARAVFAAQQHPGAIPLRAFRTVVGRLPGRFERRETAVAQALERRIAS